MSVVDIKIALEQAVNGMTPALATAWENAPFTPTPGTPYQKVNILFAEPDNPTMGDGFYREVGILQITLMYPVQEGTAAINARAELIRTTFQRGAVFTENSVNTTIETTPAVAPGFVDGDRWAVPVRVKFYANIC